MNFKLRAMPISIALLMLSAMLTTALAQPFAWTNSHPIYYNMGGDPTVSRGASGSGFMQPIVSTAIPVTATYSTSIKPDSYLGKAVKISAFVKTTLVELRAGIFVTVVGPGGLPLMVDEMRYRPLSGNTDWQLCEIILDVPETSTLIRFGLLIQGYGFAYIDGLKLETAERTWNLQNTGTTQSIAALKAVSDNTVWAGAASGTYLRTTDGGANWKVGTVPGAAALTMSSIAPINENVAYYTAQDWSGATSDARIYKTTDGGATWTQQYRNTGSGAFFNSIAFWDETHGVAVSDPVGTSFLIVTTSDGVNWSVVPTANIPAPQNNEWGGFGDVGGTSLFVQGTGNAWFGTGFGFGSVAGNPVRVIKSTDQGKNWVAVNTPLPARGDFVGISTVAFADAQTGFAGSYKSPYNNTESTLVKTTDGGQTWNVVPTLTIQPTTMQYVPNSNNTMMVTSSQQGSAYSLDGGNTWRLLRSTLPTAALSFASPVAGWTVSMALSGKIFRFSGDLRTAVAEREVAAQPVGFYLAQNYPNPFSPQGRGIFDNPSTMIQYELPQASHVQLAIYNLLGERVRTLVDAKESVGVKHITWDGRNDRGERVSSGVYVYRIEAGEFRTARRLVLMK